MTDRRRLRTVAAVVAAATVAVACGGGGFTLEVGDCLRTPVEGAGPDGLAEVTKVDCEEEHDLEVFHVLELGPDQTARDAMVAEIASVCLGDAWTDYVGVPADESPLELLPIPPTEEQVADGEREVVCTVREPGGARRTGSVRAGGGGTAGPPA